MQDGMSREITSPQNPKIKQIVRLKDRKERDETGLFLIEGYREIKRAVAGGVHFDALFICPDLFLGSNELLLIESIGVETFVLPPHLFEKISYRDRPDGLIAIAHQMQKTLADLHPKNDPPLYVVAESIEKPGNLGTILRSSDAVGADGVIVCDRCTDIYNPNVVRASVGTLFTLPVVEAKGSDVYIWLKERKIQVIAATPSAEMEYTEAPLDGPVAIVVGTEQLGLSDMWMEAADIRVKIPMKGIADSLNVAMATTLLLYEVLRQRKHRLL
jgi:TrmH family RNA methyltransferase